MRIATSPFSRPVLAVLSLAIVSACATANARTAPSAADSMVRRYVLDYVHVPGAPGDLVADIQAAWAALRAGDDLGARQALDLASPASRDTAGANTAEGLLSLSRGPLSRGGP